MSKLTLQSTFPVANGSSSMPRLGFGVYQSSGSTCVNAVKTALSAGYRHVDSAQYYQNEGLVAQAIKEAGVPRESIFLTTKQLSPSGSVDSTYNTVLDSVKNLGGSYVDLFLIHSASSGSSGRKTLWQALEKAHSEGLCKAIGVSNWGVGHIEELKSFAKVWPPHVNQIELHPWHQQREIVDYCKKQGIIVQAYCPLVRNQKADDPTLNSIAKKHNISTGQVLVRYSLQKDWVPLPKSDTPVRIKSNADVYSFELDSADMKALDDLDQGAAGAIVESVVNK